MSRMKETSVKCTTKLKTHGTKNTKEKTEHKQLNGHTQPAM